ncbi:hypothetical protein OIU78_003121 [Salix suchowensis]|nr:hypothetical protein OIU78_003121 [Salix suchowensis]
MALHLNHFYPYTSKHGKQPKPPLTSARPRPTKFQVRAASINARELIQSGAVRPIPPKEAAMAMSSEGFHPPGHQTRLGERQGSGGWVIARATLCQRHRQQSHNSFEEVGSFWIRWLMDWSKFHHVESRFSPASGGRSS